MAALSCWVPSPTLGDGGWASRTAWPLAQTSNSTFSLGSQHHTPQGQAQRGVRGGLASESM